MIIFMIIIQVLVLVYSVILHEISHGLVAERLGDPTARISGRLTLKPKSHIDPVMTIAVPLILILVGSPVIFGGAKPVPVDSLNFRRPKRDIALVSAAGPLTNFAIAVILAILLNILALLSLPVGWLSAISQVITYGIIINVILGLFNLLPIPPLDGFKVVGGFLPDHLAADWYNLEKFGLIPLFILLFFFSSSVSSVFYSAANSIVQTLLSIKYV